MKPALVHYWLTGKRGGEIVLEAIGRLLPDADLYAHVIAEHAKFGSLANGRKLTETFIAGLPHARRRNQLYLPLMPLALEALDMSSYDLIVSSEAGPAKWIIPHPNARHVCYCHSPLRYIWDQQHIYLQQIPSFLHPVARAYAGHLRKSDVISAARVDDFVANSSFVAKRIWKYYRREADVVHPPVDTALFSPSEQVEDWYLVAGELVPYKRVDLAIKAARELGRRLRIVGSGKELERLKRLAGGDDRIEFLGRLSDEEFRGALSRCRALIFPGVEDFGLVPVEVMASGRPVIALGKGGALDSVEHGVTGVLFPEQTVESLKRAILEFEAEEDAFRPQACIRRARRFDIALFQARMAGILGVPEPQNISGAPPFGKNGDNVLVLAGRG